jgi:hypothetical protein
MTVIFDEILTNDGNGYDDSTGEFTCSVAGTYMFVLDVLSRKPQWISIALNNERLASVHISTDNTGWSYQQLSRTVIIKLEQGDVVKVVNDKETGFVHNDRYSGFSGTLLY